jgi:hypothetical protein
MKSVREEIVWHLRHLPTLHFQSFAHGELALRQPDLHRRPEEYVAFKGRVSEASPHPALEVFVKALEEGVRPLDYTDTTPEQWREYFRFACDRFVPGAGGRYRIESVPDAVSGDYVNLTAERARNWFRDTLIPLVRRPDGPSAYLLGDPGAGKSTLLKYLINNERPFIEERNVVFSRFEFLKFLRSGPPDQPLERKREQYVSYILLRDLLWSSHAYEHLADGPSRLTLPAARLERWVDDAIAEYDFLEPLRARTLQALKAALEPDSINFRELRNVPADVRPALVKQLAKGKTLAIIVDGLDCLSLEDRDFNSERFRALRFIMDSRPRLAHLSVGLALLDDKGGEVHVPVTLAAGTLFVMRDNTFFHFEKRLRDDIDTDEELAIYRVHEISPHAAMYNVILRAVRHWARSPQGDPERVEEVAARLTKATLNLLRFINRALRTGHSHRYVLGLFGGSMRSLFDFMEAVLRWFVEDSLREGALKLTAASTADDVLDFIAGAAGRSVIHRRSYRILETLMFIGLPWYENRVSIKRRSGFAQKYLSEENLGIAPGYIFQDNENFCGVVDNIYNYHATKHAAHMDDHCFVEKARVVQLLRDHGAMNSDQLEELLLEELGYESPDLHTSLTILIRGGMVKATVVQGDILLSASDRGRIVVDHFCKTMAYLEHVFHRTLFPEPLVRTLSDLPRREGVDDWTAASIRNAFAMLAYLNAVETNEARGRRVRKTKLISDDVREEIIKSISRILRDLVLPEGEVVLGSRRTAAAVIRRSVAYKALTMIQNLISDWELAGVATAPLRTDPPTGAPKIATQT